MWADWRHITKLDPDKKITRNELDIVASSGTDALIVGGTQRITKRKVEKLLDQIKHYDLPVVLEPSSYEAVIIKDVDFVFIPSVINSQDPRWIIGEHSKFVQTWEKMGKELPWEKIVGEAYIVLNPASSVAEKTNPNICLDADQIAGYAVIAERYFRFPIVYIEYSGQFGNPDIVKQVKNSINQASLFYGGGIDTSEKANIMSRFATIIVGNVVYDDINAFLRTIPSC